MNNLKFKILPASSNGNNLYVDVKPRKWYIAYLYLKIFVREFLIERTK